MVQPVPFRYTKIHWRPKHGHLAKYRPTRYFSLVSQSEKVYRYDDLVARPAEWPTKEEDLKGNRPERAVRVFKDAWGNCLAVGFEWRSRRGQNRRDVVLTWNSRVRKLLKILWTGR
jgi:hypothetical protein